MTRTPVRFSLVSPVTRSSPACTFLNSGILISIMENTTTNRIGTVTTKISAQRTLMVNAITIAPITTNGLLSNRRSPILIPFCTWFTSSVSLVISVSVPSVSSSVNDSLWIWSNIACLTLVANPTLAFAAKNCAVKLHNSPTAAMSSNTKNISTIYPRSFFATPTSMIWATTTGTIRSNTTSFLYFLVSSYY